MLVAVVHFPVCVCVCVAHSLHAFNTLNLSDSLQGHAEDLQELLRHLSHLCILVYGVSSFHPPPPATSPPSPQSLLHYKPQCCQSPAVSLIGLTRKCKAHWGNFELSTGLNWMNRHPQGDEGQSAAQTGAPVSPLALLHAKPTNQLLTAASYIKVLIFSSGSRQPK